MQITVRFKGGRVIRGLKNIGDAIPDVGYRALYRKMKDAMEIARTYPPELPNQRYRRTGIYGRSFKLEKVATGKIAVRIISDAVQKGRHYTVYVGGNALGLGQARIHQGRWAVIAKVVDRMVSEQVVKEVEADLGKVIRQQGMGI